MDPAAGSCFGISVVLRRTFAVTLLLQPILRRLGHGQALQPNLFIDQHRLLRLQVPLQIEGSARVTLADVRLEGLQPPGAAGR